MKLEDRLSAIKNAARPYLETRNNHAHSRSSLEIARRLLEAEGGDPAVVLPAIILHDVGWSAVPEEEQLLAFGPGHTRPDLNRLHEVAGSRLAADILAGAGYDTELSGRIVEIIEGHDSRTVALSLEDAIVKDADKLHRLTPSGFLTDAARFGLDPIRYLAILTERSDWFLTPTGRRLAGEALGDLGDLVDEVEPETAAT